jgi:hypothetical protein
MIVDQNSFPVAKVEPELQEPVPDPEKKVIAGWRKVTSASPQKKSVRGEKFDAKVQRVCVADQTEE